MSEFAANPADVVEQEQDVDAEPDLEADTGAVGIPDDANEADALEQSIEVPENDEDYRE